MQHTNKSCNQPLYHLYSPLHIITTTLHTLPTTDQSQFLKPVITDLHILFPDPGPDSPYFISGKKAGSCMAPSVDCIAGVVRWRGPTAQLPPCQFEA